MAEHGSRREQECGGPAADGVTPERSAELGARLMLVAADRRREGHDVGGVAYHPGEATRVVLVTGSMSTAARREALLAAASGEAGIVIGTHALLSETVQFAELGLVVVDEQHRFGVEQRDALRTRAGVPPHLLDPAGTPHEGRCTG